MFDDVKARNLVRLVNSEQFDRLQDAEDRDTANNVPAQDGRSSGCVPEQHLEGGVAPSEDQT